MLSLDGRAAPGVDAGRSFVFGYGGLGERVEGRKVVDWRIAISIL